ncbi:MAG TPA: sigma-70 family RNA polymerase sigma factor [Blastocatellia bacterium]|nr:sigma-70 family RNA polymerase sigma factor [Blastocatellia bacterium]
MARGQLSGAIDDTQAERLRIEAAQRDVSLFGEIYERNFERVYAYVARRVHSRDEAQDLTSEVFHKALANLGQFEWRGVPFAAWLFKIAANAIADRSHRAAKELSLQSAKEHDALSQSERSGLEEIEERARLFRLVGQLPPDQRRVIEMRFAEDKSIREVSLELGRSEGAVKQLQFRGLQNLRERLGATNV